MFSYPPIHFQKRPTMDAQSCESGLFTRLDSIQLHMIMPEAAAAMAFNTQAAFSDILTSELQFRILARVLDFLSTNIASLPSKQVLLDSLSKAIDAAFTAANKPILSAILKPIIKAQILDIVGKLYDRITTPAPVIEV